MARLRFLVTLTILLLGFAGQIYWGMRVYRLAARLQWKSVQSAILLVLLGFYFFAIFFNGDRLFVFPRFGPQPDSTHLGFRDAFLAATEWWLITSTLAFALVIVIAIIKTAALIAGLPSRKGRAQQVRELRDIRASDLPIQGMDRPIVRDPVTAHSRRHFLEYGAAAVVGMPFVAGAYALLYGRLNLEIVRKRILLPRLPREFAGFRVAQLSDVHISSFMPEDQIRKYAAITNELHPDLIVLTGDFLSWDPSAGGAVVNALAGLRAPLGVFACLGNHEAWSDAKDSMTRLLEAAGIKVLRDQRVPIVVSKEQLNLIGIEPEYGWTTMLVPEGLLEPQRVNILLSHYPTVFDHAAELGYDLTLAGHTHGGQVPLSFVSPRMVVSSLKAPYFRGFYEQRGKQLYVNRGIGTIGLPMRIGATPEITVFEIHPT